MEADLGVGAKTGTRFGGSSGLRGAWHCTGVVLVLHLSCTGIVLELELLLHKLLLHQQLPMVLVQGHCSTDAVCTNAVPME